MPQMAGKFNFASPAKCGFGMKQLGVADENYSHRHVYHAAGKAF
jgi:hypothetical protein